MLPAAFGRLCVETLTDQRGRVHEEPAAFGRLCVETYAINIRGFVPAVQPPSGGCVLKLNEASPLVQAATQPPSGGCVLKHVPVNGGADFVFQPPSGGCVLKQLP